MWYITLILIAVLGFIFTPKVMAQSHKMKKSEKKKMIQTKETVEIVSETVQPLFSKKQIEDKLMVLEKTPPPTDLAFGAMCYSMAMPPQTVDYVCPICGNKTAYNNVQYSKEENDKNTYNEVDGSLLRFIQWELTSCRHEIENVKGINIILDEKEFCKHCSPKVTEPVLYLLVNIGGEQKTTKIPIYSNMDIRLIREFLDGEILHVGSNGDQTPLVDYMDRIKELLGIKE